MDHGRRAGPEHDPIHTGAGVGRDRNEAGGLFVLVRLDAFAGADRGWLPRARQIGITGRRIRPRLYVAVGLSGKFNHMVGVRSAGTVLAVNNDTDAPVFSAADVGIVADWREAIPLLVAELSGALASVRI